MSEKETRNFLVLGLHHISVRVGWIFKTETVIMPVFVDTISGAGWVRGLLPVLNRVGQSVPPFLLAHRIRATRLRKAALFSTTLLMGATFLALAGLESLRVGRVAWMVPVFLTAYFLFFAFNGLMQVSFHTLQGVLIRPWRRGRLMAWSGILGSLVSIFCALVLLPGWLGEDGNSFASIFSFTGCAFTLAAFMALALQEPSVERELRRPGLAAVFRETALELRRNGDFRRVAWVSALGLSSMLLFPHYQALARRDLGALPGDWITWLVAQNAGAGVFGFALGLLADRAGNRAALRIVLVASATTPLLALAISRLDADLGRRLFWLAYVFLGLVPVTMKLLINYTLELTPTDEHPSALGRLKLVFAVPFVVSPLVGWLADTVGLATVFIGISLLIFAGALRTFRMVEPRWR